MLRPLGTHARRAMCAISAGPGPVHAAAVHCDAPCTLTQAAAQHHFSPSATASPLVTASAPAVSRIGSTPSNCACAISVPAALLSDYSCPCPTQHGSSHATTHGTSIRPSCVQPGWPSPSVVHSFTVAVITTRHSSEVSPERRVSVPASKSVAMFEHSHTFIPQPEARIPEQIPKVWGSLSFPRLSVRRIRPSAAKSEGA